MTSLFSVVFVVAELKTGNEYSMPVEGSAVTLIFTLGTPIDILPALRRRGGAF